MNNLQELKENYDKNTWKTIVVSKRHYDQLNAMGFTNESFDKVIGRLLEKVELSKED